MADMLNDDDPPLHIRRGARLPHWTKEGSIYSVTFRLGDSLPSSVREIWLHEREDIVKTAQKLGRDLSIEEEKRLDYLHSQKVEKYLDAGYGACWMKDAPIANLVAKALQHFDEERYDLAAWCVMPNHVHAVLRPRSPHGVSSILHSWKSFTAHEANKLLQRTGQFWEEEYYDHLIRNEQEFNRAVAYVERNPTKAGLRNWPWVSESNSQPE